MVRLSRIMRGEKRRRPWIRRNCRRERERSVQLENGKRVMRQERSFADVVSQGKDEDRCSVTREGEDRCSVTREGEDRCSVTREGEESRIFLGDSTIRKLDKVVNRGEDIMVCLPGAKNRGCSREGRTSHGR